MKPLPIWHVHPCCASGYIAGTAESLRIHRNHCNRAHMMVQICTVHIAGQRVAHNVFTIKRQLIVYLQTTGVFAALIC